MKFHRAIKLILKEGTTFDLYFEDGIVTITFLGACVGCMAIGTTLTDGVEALLMDEVPEVKGVKMLEPDPYGFF